jgi:hypothetical protein
MVMSRKLVAEIIAVNVALGIILFLDSQQLLLSLSNPSAPMRVVSVDFFSVYTAWVQVGSNPVPAIVTPMPNYPSYVFLAIVIVNVCFVAVLLRRKTS